MKKQKQIKNLFFLIVTATFIFSSCGYKEVKIEDVRDVKLGKTNSKEINIDFKLVIDNPNNYKIKIIKYDIDLIVNRQIFRLFNENANIVIPKKFTGTLPISVQLIKEDSGIFSFQSLILLGEILKNKTAYVEAKGYVKVGAFLLSKKIDVDEKRTLNF